MLRRGRLDHVLKCIGLMIFLLTVLDTPSTTASPAPAAMELISLGGPLENSKIENAPPSRLHRIFDDWIGGNKVRMVAEVTKPHIKRWHHRRRYRGVHH